MSNQVVKRYSAVALFNPNLDRVVLIHKLRPAWQAGKANFPGGKVEDSDRKEAVRKYCIAWSHHEDAGAHLHCAARELIEETGISVAAESLTLFCTLRFNSPATDTAQPQPAECRFYCAVGDVDQARTVEAEPVFVADVDDVLDGQVDCNAVTLPTMGNLPWLVAMARQRLRGDVEWRPGYVVEEVVSVSA